MTRSLRVAARLRLTLSLVTACGLLQIPLCAEDVSPLTELSKTIAELKEGLEINDQIRPSVVDQDSRLVSVRRSKTDPGTFELHLERSFVETLTPRELRAVVAHELGHVWIYTHHPFLQTEGLANRIAQRVIDKNLLESVYAKVTAFRTAEKARTVAKLPSSDGAVGSAGLSSN